MDTTTFYAAASALCFTLLGFWWVVVQFRHAELTRRLRAALHVPGLAALHRAGAGVAGLAARDRADVAGRVRPRRPDGHRRGGREHAHGSRPKPARRSVPSGWLGVPI